MNRSFWEKDIIPDYDYIIIGGGLVGCMAAYNLRERSKQSRIAIVDKHAIPTGASSRNAGFACFGSITELLDDLSNQTEEESKNLIRDRWNGLQRLRNIIPDEVLEYKNLGGIEVFQPDRIEYNESCFEKLDMLNHIVNESIGLRDTFKLQEKNYGFGEVSLHTVINQYEGQLHPGKMMNFLYQMLREHGVDFYLGCEVEAYQEEVNDVHVSLSNGYNTRCQQLLIATNAFTKDIFPDLALTPGRNQVMITKPIAGLTLQGCFHYDRGYVYFRNYKNRILLGGGRNIDKNENTTEFGFSAIIQDYLMDIMSKIILPNIRYEIDARWSGIIGLSDVKTPIIQKNSKRIQMGVRLGGMGVAIGSLVGEKLANLAQS